MTEFSAADLAFLEAADSVLQLRCGCKFNGTHPPEGCGHPAAVTIRMHLPHHCKRPDLIEQGVVDADGNVSQLLCGGCYHEARAFCEAKIAQTHAICMQLSTRCQTCEFPLGYYHEGSVVVHDVCPHCSSERIVFRAVCGAGASSYGCGAPMNTHTDIIRSEVWL